MNKEQKTDTGSSPLNAIRVETALSRYPVHRLAKHRGISIDIREESQDGELLVRWEVDHSGQRSPGPLAYKIDTLVVNRRIEEASRPVPRLIKLGSLNQICRELGSVESGKNTTHIKDSLHQNASAYIKAKIRYKQPDGAEQTLETGFTRYSVIFTGQKLPDGRAADAVYLILTDVYMQVINGAMTRPLDYDYLKSLPPAPQRFYELLSYQMYASLKYDRARAKLVYSEYCRYAPQARYCEFDGVKKQMYKIHTHHRKSGYIAGVDFDQTIDSDGQPDWIMLYTPGPRARAEYGAFARRGGPVMLEVEPTRIGPDTSPPEPEQLLLELETPPLARELIQRDIHKSKAIELVQRHPAETIQAKIDVFDWLMEKHDKRAAKSPAGYLVKSIENGYKTPSGYISRSEREQQAENQRQAARAAAAERRRTQTEDARQEERHREEDAYWSKLTPTGQAELEARALAEAGEEDQQTYATLKRLRGGGKSYLADIRRAYIRTLIDAEQLAFP